MRGKQARGILVCYCSVHIEAPSILMKKKKKKKKRRRRTRRLVARYCVSSLNTCTYAYISRGCLAREMCTSWCLRSLTACDRCSRLQLPLPPYWPLLLDHLETGLLTKIRSFLRHFTVLKMCFIRLIVRELRLFVFILNFIQATVRGSSWIELQINLTQDFTTTRM